MSTIEATTAPTIDSGRLALAEQVLRQTEAKVGVKRQADTLTGGFYETRSGGIFGELGIPALPEISVGITGSNALLLAMIAEVAAEGKWVAIIGMPSLGIVAGAEFGLDSSRIVLIPDPRAQSAKVLTILIDGFDVVVVGAKVSVHSGQRRSLVARARNQRTTLFAPLWPELPVRLEARVLGWVGVERGRGYVDERDVLVARQGYGGQGQVRLNLKGGKFRAIDARLQYAG